MSGIFPNNGVAPGSPQVAGISYSPEQTPIEGCPPLYFKNGCKNVGTPEMWNWLIANIAHLVDKACPAPIDCTSSSNILDAIQCLLGPTGPGIPPCPDDTGCWQLQCVDGVATWVQCPTTPASFGPPRPAVWFGNVVRFDGVPFNNPNPIGNVVPGSELASGIDFVTNLGLTGTWRNLGPTGIQYVPGDPSTGAGSSHFLIFLWERIS